MDTTRPSLLLRIKDRGDQGAWREFDAIYRPLLQRIALARGLGENEAEDIAQQCMATINRHIERFDYDPRRGRFKSWLATMVNNRIRNALRDRHEVGARTKDFADLSDHCSSPEEVFDKLWRQEHLRHCLHLIRSEVQTATFEIFIAHVVEGNSTAQVCAAFDVTADQVHAIKSRMTRRVRQRMADLLGGEE